MKIQSFPPIVNQHSKVLILGTMPGNESLKRKEYYANSKNHFWDIMFRVLIADYHHFSTAQETETYARKIELLLENKIALWDTLQYCDRKGSLDKAIRNENKNDFDMFFEKHKNISKVIFNGKKAHKYFMESFKSVIEQRELKLFILNSTSSTNTNNVFYILKEWRNALIA